MSALDCMFNIANVVARSSSPTRFEAARPPGGGGSARLTRKEAGRVLRLRTDLPKDEISSLLDMDEEA